MHALVFRFDAGTAPELPLLLRRVAMVPPPAIEGLRARYWRIRRHHLWGRYLFDSSGQVECFARGPVADPAYGLVAAHAASDSATVLQEEVADCDRLDRPIFIISAPRAGSTLLYELLANSEHLWTIDGESEGVIEGIPQLHPANRGFDSHRLTDFDADTALIETLHAGFTAELMNSEGRRLLEMPRESRPLGIRMIEKTPENSLRVSFLAAAFPSAKFVFLHRDARQNVSSILEAWQHDGFVNIPALPGWPRGHWNFLLPEGWRSLRGSSLLEIAAYQWNAANQCSLHDFDGLERERWMSVDYNEFVVSPAAVVHWICEFIGVPVGDRLAAALSRPLPVSSTTISPPSPIKWRSNPQFSESVLDRYTLTSARLRDLGRQSAPPPPPRRWNAPVRYSCFVDELPVAAPQVSDDQWIVNPSFHFQLGPTIPLDLIRRTRFRDRFLADYPILWVQDAGTHTMLPFWIRRHEAHLYSLFVAGEPPSAGIGIEMVARLAYANVLVTRAQVEGRRREIENLVAQAGPHFDKNRFCVLPQLLHPAHAAALTRYYEVLMKRGEWQRGDEQVVLRHGLHNEPVARYFHLQFTNIVSRVAGAPVRPSYAYVSAYHPGAALKPHVDRKQCVFTLSVLIERASGGADRWPLWFWTDSDKVCVTQTSGGVVLFRGCELPHWRNRPPDNASAITLIFHYVPRDFTGVLD